MSRAYFARQDTGYEQYGYYSTAVNDSSASPMTPDTLQDDERERETADVAVQIVDSNYAVSFFIKTPLIKTR